MKGLLRKEFYTTSIYCRSYLLIVVLFLLTSFVGDQDNMFFMMFPCIFTGTIPVTLQSYDERERWISYSGTLPCSRRQLVASKYLIGLIAELAVLAITAVAVMFKVSTADGLTMTDAAAILGGCAFIGFLCPSLMLPFIFKFGVEKGRIVYYVMLITGSALMGILTNERVFPMVAQLGFWFYLILAGIAVILYFASYTASVSIYSRKDL